MALSDSDSIPGWDRQTVPAKGTPHGWIQFKGTDICMDVHCVCGYFGHVDDDFVYYVKCPACHRVYMVNGYVELVLLTNAEATSKDLFVGKVKSIKCDQT